MEKSKTRRFLMETIKYNKEDLEKFISENKSTEEIGIIYNVSGRTIRNWFKKEGLESNVRTKGFLNVTNKSDEQKHYATEQLIKYSKEKLKDRITCICEICKNEYKITKCVKELGTRFCSNKCKYYFLFNTKPENHPRWLGGKSQENQIGRSSLEYVEWRINVFRHDFFTCQKCKQKGKKLNAHHINSWIDYIDMRYDVNNGITLCIECHKLLHKIYGQKTNNIHLNEFLGIKCESGWKRTNLENF